MNPLFLDASCQEHLSLVEKAISFYESYVGREKGEVNFHEMRYLIGDDRLADGLRYALDHLYVFTRNKQSRNIGSSPSSLRIQLFRYVGSTPEGFASNRSEVIRRFISKPGREIDFSAEEFDAYLWSDDSKRLVLERKSIRPSPADVIRHYNFEVIDTLLSNSKKITFTTEGNPKMPKGTFVKKIVWKAKQFGLLYDAELKGEKVMVTLSGPIELFGRATRFARRISTLFTELVPILGEAGGWSVNFVVQLKRRSLLCVLDNDRLPAFSGNLVGDEEEVPTFDSRVERKFYGTMSSVKGFQIERESEPLVVGDSLMVPDYIFTRDNKKWYLEIIGFWRPEYTNKKRAKLLQLKKSGLERLILLVEEKYLKHFQDLGFPTFSYKMSGEKLRAPYGQIVNCILGE